MANNAKKETCHVTAAEGAGDHCEIMNRSAVNRGVFDWLDGDSTVTYPDGRPACRKALR